MWYKLFVYKQSRTTFYLHDFKENFLSLFHSKVRSVPPFFTSKWNTLTNKKIQWYDSNVLYENTLFYSIYNKCKILKWALYLCWNFVQNIMNKNICISHRIYPRIFCKYFCYVFEMRNCAVMISAPRLEHWKRRIFGLC